MLTTCNPMDYTYGYADHCLHRVEFQKKSDKLISNAEQHSIINYLAAHPAAGDIMQGTGGIRKLRWAVKGKGRSGGVRIIYYFHNDSIPLFLLTLFGKGERSNLSKTERNGLAKLVSLIVESYGDQNE